ETVRALGLRKIRQTVVHEDTPQVRGMIAAVEHLVDWEIVEE
ncbi:MAG TPA: 50S ribosomal protein L30, partial [Synergistales bacterium]|nr:50S ribosomal protein L30 [Synergistales bacterium]